MSKFFTWVKEHWWAAVGFVALIIGYIFGIRGAHQAEEVLEAKSDFAKEEEEILTSSLERDREIAQRYTRLIKEVAEQHRTTEAEIEEETRQELLDEAKKSQEDPRDFARRMAAQYGLDFVE